MLIFMLHLLVHGLNEKENKSIGGWSLISPLQKTDIFVANTHKEILINGFN